ncbi:MAG: LysR substrate-binding domain-containing protein [Paracoccus sp. (in: a-proteobacteria)]|nr:LysR substrate-binding domain-containing protein [Paracoccus sp. (in: a-proteobacteria)]
MELPPMSALRVFEAASRHLSFTRAGESLGMTQAAVSYQIKLLEERMGGALFLRKPRGLELTALGLRLATPTVEAFELLRNTYAQSRQGATFAISAFASFAGNWLSQRLGRFQMENSDLAVRMDSSNHVVDFTREEFDVAIRYGAGNWPGLVAHRLMAVDFAPMMSPGLAREWGPLREPADIVPLPWIDPSDPDWMIWLEQCGLRRDCTPRPGLKLGTQVHEARVAMADGGVALLTPRFFRAELASGQLVQPFPAVTENGKSYWLVYPHTHRNNPVIRKFRQFLLAEIAAEDAVMADRAAKATYPGAQPAKTG